MPVTTLVDRCKTTTNIDTDTFVGIKAVGGNITIHFPLGFRFGVGEKGRRKDILLLLNVLSKHIETRESVINKHASFNAVDIPIQAYLGVIADYYQRGYYKETEPIFKIGKRGKIDWGKTIKTQRGFFQNNGVYYLNYVTRRNNNNEKELISLIHKYCVYESFSKIGWLFTDTVPEKPPINLNKKLFTAVVRKKIAETYNDRDRRLFQNLLAIISSLGDDGPAGDFVYGTNRFEYVWESLIDMVFGIPDKEYYFPRTKWIVSGHSYNNKTLEPDTIMIHEDTIYVLDAKYYKYGNTGIASHLPDSSSISKQITYGEYIAESDEFVDTKGNHPKVYNAFLMPYDSYGEKFHTEKAMHYIGKAVSDWKSSDGTNPYEIVEGILLDVKTLMQEQSCSKDSIIELASLIERCVAKDTGR